MQEKMERPVDKTELHKELLARHQMNSFFAHGATLDHGDHQHAFVPCGDHMHQVDTFVEPTMVASEEGVAFAFKVSTVETSMPKEMALLAYAMLAMEQLVDDASLSLSSESESEEDFSDEEGYYSEEENSSSPRLN